MKDKINHLIDFIHRKIDSIFYFATIYPIYKIRFREIGYKTRIMSPLLITPSFIRIKNKVSVRNGARIEGVSVYLTKTYSPDILIEDNVTIEQNSHITCANKITISKNTAIAANVTITDIDHPYIDINTPPEKQELNVGFVFIGEDCKIYNNSVILPNAQIGKHTIIAANSVVLGKIYPAYCVLAGIPARIIKRYSFETNSWKKTDSQGNFLEV
ncbi:acyltransferase [Parabacteroides sp. FAFU027]|uniref:acyltransferase n=1 Tax=Parabacteroides sp. FAFU027 TaxID=2922715 RepID=UPI001FAF2BA5|nr:acyltransferase [Parabacteroides sp. FAFU027]